LLEGLLHEGRERFQGRRRRRLRRCGAALGVLDDEEALVFQREVDVMRGMGLPGIQPK
jgi:hypothetical protein